VGARAPAGLRILSQHINQPRPERAARTGTKRHQRIEETVRARRGGLASRSVQQPETHCDVEQRHLVADRDSRGSRVAPVASNPA
jgi:hypothetical protein